MRTLLKAQIPVEKGNVSLKEGKLPQVVERVLEMAKAEAAYFYAEGGLRTCLIVFDLADSSDIPRFAEPFFQDLNASVTFTPVMNGDDLKAGIGKAMAAL